MFVSHMHFRTDIVLVLNWPFSHLKSSNVDQSIIPLEFDDDADKDFVSLQGWST